MSKSRRKKKRQMEVYSKQQYLKDEASFDNSLNNHQPIDIRAFQRLIKNDLYTKSKVLETNSLGYVKLDDVRKALKNPMSMWRVLIRASDYLMRISPFYYRLNNYYSNMALCLWGIDLYDVKYGIENDTKLIEALNKNYNKLSAKLESMNLKHEFSKIMKVLPYQDIYCGLIAENDRDFFIQQVRYDMCKLYQVQDGIYDFAIDLNYISLQNMSSFPDYVQQAYIDFKDGKIDNWYIPPADKQICLKLNSHWVYPYPMMIGLIRDLLDLDIYKDLKLQSARTDNYKAIMVEVPIDKGAVDKPLLTLDTLAAFSELNRSSMNDDIGYIHTIGGTGEAISFKDSSNTRNNVSDAVNEIYNSSGESKELYNGSSSGTAVKLSVENDSGFIYGIYRQFERWVNRYIKVKKYNKANYKFSFYMLDATIFNRDEVNKRYRESLALGATVVDKWLATLDMTPSKVFGSYVLHKNIFNYTNNFITLQSAYNSSQSEAGRPTADSKGEQIGDSGEKTKDLDSNADR